MGRKRFTDSPISAKATELAKQEDALRRKMEDLQREIEEAPRIAKEQQEQQKRDRVLRAYVRRSPFDSPDILQDSRHSEDLFSNRPKKPRRAQRRQARTRLLVTSLAVLVLSAVVVFLVIQMFNHL
jgi:anti-sigma factor RsiW